MKSLYSCATLFLMICCLGCGVDDGTDAREALMQAFLRFGDTPIEDDSGAYFYSVVDAGEGQAVVNEDYVVVAWRAFDINANVLQTTGEFPAVGAISSFNAIDNTNMRRIGKGGTVRIYIPAVPGQAPENAQIYELTINEVYDDVNDYNDQVIQDYLSAQNLVAERTDQGLYYIIDEEGDGDFPQSQSVVTVRYEGYFLNGDVFDSSRGETITFSLQQVIEGWTLGIPLFNEGGGGTLLIPSTLAYGNAGTNGIPPNYPIAFDVELVSIE